MKNQSAVTSNLLKFFRLLRWIDEKRRDHPGWAQVCTWALQATFLYFCSLWVEGIHVSNPSWWPFPPGKFDAGKAILLGCSLLTTFSLQQFILRFLLPLLTYVPQAIVLKALGVKHLLEGPDYKEVNRLFEREVKKHPEGVRIRVLCISGKTLFRTPKGPYESPSLLHRLAREGLLEVLMPVSSPDNLTVKARFNTFSPAYRASHCSCIERLVNDIEDSKRFLRQFNNIVHEHDSLIVWRLILLERYCFAQNYFTSELDDKGPMIDAPMFIYGEGELAEARHPEIAKFSFYRGYAELWRLFKEEAVKRKRQESMRSP